MDKSLLQVNRLSSQLVLSIPNVNQRTDILKKHLLRMFGKSINNIFYTQLDIYQLENEKFTLIEVKLNN